MIQSFLITKGRHGLSLSDRWRLWRLTRRYQVVDFRLSGVREDLGDDRWDWNKLLGTGRIRPKVLTGHGYDDIEAANFRGFTLGGFRIGIMAGHHWRSHRIAWRWNPKREALQYAVYEYHRGHRKHVIITREDALLLLKHDARYGARGATLFPWHGGNRKATRTITVFFDFQNKE